MSSIYFIFKRELKGYFSTPLAYVFIVIFLFLSGFMTFQMSDFFRAGQASLASFFAPHPWLYLILASAVAMRLWAEERDSGTIELLFTLPVTLTQALVAKFLAAWAILGISLALTFPVVLTVRYLGSPDYGVILAAYLGSFLMAGAYLAIGACMSALSKSQVVSFILTVVVCLLLILAGFPPVLDFFTGWAPAWLIEAVSSVSFYTHFDSIQRGVIVLPDLVFFLSLIVAPLYACGVILEMKKAQ